MTTWKVCPDCEGNGKVLNSAFRGQVIEPELASDPEFMEEMSCGVYDVSCPTCGGLRVVEDSPEAEALRESAEEWAAEIRRESMMLGEY
jgi:hypothetical protein